MAGCAIWYFVFSTWLYGVTSAAPSWKRPPQDIKVRPHENVTIFCEMNDLEPSTTVIWQNSTQVLFVSRARHHAPSRFSLEEKSGGRYYNMLIRDVRREDDDQYQCSVPGLLRSAQLTVIVEPKTPVIRVDSAEALTEGVTVNLTCSSQEGNPPPQVKWFRNGQRIVEGHYIIPPDTKFGTTVGILPWTLTRHDHNATFMCSVENEGNSGMGRQDSLSLRVQYRPEVKLSPSGPIRVLRHDDVIVKCEIDANPAAHTVTWYRNDIRLPDSGSTIEIKNADSTVHNANLKCSAENPIGRATISTNLEVIYPPEVSIPNVKSKKIYVQEFHSVNLQCAVQANPYPTDIWWQKVDSSKRIAGTVLRIDRTSREDSGTYMCSASNVLTPSGKATRLGTANTTVQLIVQYAPGPASIQLIHENPKTKGHPVQGQSFMLKCNTQTPGNPIGKFVWTKVGDDSYNRQGEVVLFNSVILADRGIYKCTPVNSIGSGKPAAYQLEVREEPSFVAPVLEASKYMVITDIGQSLTCAVKGNPVPVIKWFKDNKHIQQPSDQFTVTATEEAYDLYASKASSTLRWRGTTRSPRLDSLRVNDSGIYTCVASNGIGSDITATVHVHVHYLPEIRSVHPYGKVAVDLDQSISLVCQSHALPHPDIQWYHNAMRLTKNDHVYISTSQVSGMFSHQSVLTLNKVKIKDLGQYRCVARNILGTKTALIKLQLRSVPDPVRHLRIYNVTSHSVNIFWQLGFDGGYPQSFVVVQTSPQETAVEENTNSQSGKFKVQGLLPATSYTFMVYSKNKLGSGAPSMTVSTTTKPALVADPADAVYNPEEKLLKFSPPAARYCVRILVRYDGTDWQVYKPCAPSGGGSLKVSTPKPISHMNVSFCLQSSPHVCSHGVLAIIERDNSIGSSTTIVIVVGGVCGVVVVGLVLLLAILCCRRRSHGSKAGPMKKSANPDRKNLKLSPKENVSSSQLHDDFCDKTIARKTKKSQANNYVDQNLSPDGSRIPNLDEEEGLVNSSNMLIEKKSHPSTDGENAENKRLNKHRGNAAEECVIFYDQKCTIPPQKPLNNLQVKPNSSSSMTVHWSPSIDSCIELDNPRDVHPTTSYKKETRHDAHSEHHSISKNNLPMQDFTRHRDYKQDLDSSRDSFPVLDLTGQRDHKHDTHSQSSEESGYATPTNNLKKIVHEVVV